MFLLWVILEFLIFFKLVSLYGFLQIFALYTLPSFIGIIILFYYPKAWIQDFQKSWQSTEKPARKLLHHLFITVSGLFFLIPSIFTRIIGLTLSLPLLRHLVVLVVLFRWFQWSRKFMSRYQVFNMGSQGFAFYTTFMKGQSGFNSENQAENFSSEFASEGEITELKDVTPKADNILAIDSKSPPDSKSDDGKA